jgi:predicted ATP-dependent endonuclease of OLD family
LFYTFVKDERDPSLIKLEERSKGFQWFFSFDLLFMHESGGTFKNCVLLLDEPGLHLHPDAQKDLLKRMEAYAEGNVLIYTSHLPFMIDLRQPARIRVMSETAGGNAVSEDLTQSQPEGKLVLQAALGMSGSTSHLVAERNLVVEGVDDHWIVTELSNLLIRSGENGLPDDVLITPAGGASEAAYIATFMIGQKLKVVVLLDTDRAGEDARDGLVKRWLTRYREQHAEVLSLGPATGTTGKDFAIEDLFPDDYYKTLVEEVYQKQLALTGNPTLTLLGNDMLCKRVERALTDVGITFNKGSVAKTLRHRLSRMKTLAELPKETQERGRALIAAINKTFEKIDRVG